MSKRRPAGFPSGRTRPAGTGFAGSSSASGECALVVRHDSPRARRRRGRPRRPAPAIPERPCPTRSGSAAAPCAPRYGRKSAQTDSATGLLCESISSAAPCSSMSAIVAREMDFADPFQREGVEIGPRVVVQVDCRDMHIVDVEQQAAARACSDLAQEFGLRYRAAGKIAGSWKGFSSRMRRPRRACTSSICPHTRRSVASS